MASLLQLTTTYAARCNAVVLVDVAGLSAESAIVGWKPSSAFALLLDKCLAHWQHLSHKPLAAKTASAKGPGVITVPSMTFWVYAQAANEGTICVTAVATSCEHLQVLVS